MKHSRNAAAGNTLQREVGLLYSLSRCVVKNPVARKTMRARTHGTRRSRGKRRNFDCMKLGTCTTTRVQKVV